MFAGKPERVEPAIVKALAAAPHPVIGGPHEAHIALAETILADQDNLGSHLVRLRAPEDRERLERGKQQNQAARRVTLQNTIVAADDPRQIDEALANRRRDVNTLVECTARAEHFAAPNAR